MASEIKSKEELASLASSLYNESNELSEIVADVKTSLIGISNFDGIDVSSKASVLSDNLSNVSSDLETVVTNIKNYVSQVTGFDIDDFSISSSNGEIVSSDEGDNLGDNSANINNTSVTQSSNTWGSLSGAAVSYASSGSSSSYGYSKVNYSTASATSDSVLHLTAVKTSSGDPNIDISKYHNNIEMGFEVTAGNLAYDLSDDEIELLCAIVAAESDKTYDDALAVITTILNRCEASNWIRSHGTHPIAQATAPNQFVVYQHGSYKKYMNGNAPATVVAAVKDALAGVRNHKYLSFRSNGTTSYSNNMISKTGNRYK